MRYFPGLIDSQRSDHFVDCVTANSNMTMVDECKANGVWKLAFSGGQALLIRHPDITMLHAGNTAVALGILAAEGERGVLDDVIINGWDGGADEIKSIRDGGLKVTAFRVNGDCGVAVAKAIRAHPEGGEVRVVLAATIKPPDDARTVAEIDARTDYAFRYSGQLDRWGAPSCRVWNRPLRSKS